MCAFLLLFALSYWLLGFRGQGLTTGGGWVHFPDCLYFSVVTFTSLGYGDIVPHGFGKILACLEVMLGLAFLGVFIAKLTSSKQSYHLSQLYARDAQERLEGFSTMLQAHTDECVSMLELLKRNERLPRGMRKRYYPTRMVRCGGSGRTSGSRSRMENSCRKRPPDRRAVYCGGLHNLSARSPIWRAIRNRYIPRSRGASRDILSSCANRSGAWSKRSARIGPYDRTMGSY